MGILVGLMRSKGVSSPTITPEADDHGVLEQLAEEGSLSPP